MYPPYHSPLPFCPVLSYHLLHPPLLTSSLLLFVLLISSPTSSTLLLFLLSLLPNFFSSTNASFTLTSSSSVRFLSPLLYPLSYFSLGPFSVSSVSPLLTLLLISTTSPPITCSPLLPQYFIPLSYLFASSLLQLFSLPLFSFLYFLSLPYFVHSPTDLLTSPLFSTSTPPTFPFPSPSLLHLLSSSIPLLCLLILPIHPLSPLPLGKKIRRTKSDTIDFRGLIISRLRRKVMRHCDFPGIRFITEENIISHF